jgi:hypothetical protein
MNLNPRIVVPVLGALLGVFLLYSAANRIYFAPRAALLTDLEDATGTVNRIRASLDSRPQIQEQLHRYVSRTLGGDLETVDHRLRTRLNRIAEEVQLQAISVTTSSPRALGSPARGEFTGTAMRGLREELDFVEVPGVITGEGTLAQAIELIDRIDAEPWLKQVYDVTLDPRENGARFTVRMRLRTLFLPGHAPESEPRAPYEQERLTRLASLVQSNPFHLPPPPSPERERRVADRRSPPSFPYEQWVLTGIAEGSGGPEVWLRNRNSGETVRITVGEALAQIVLIAAQGEFAEFERGEERFLVTVGSDLNDRTPLNR